MNWRSKWTFWATVTLVLALVSVPSVEWISAFADYRSLAAGWEPAPLKPSATTFTPHGRGRIEEPSLKPVEFRHKAPKAKSVELVGDFNAWKPGLLKLKKGGDGVWSITMPVPLGKRKYLFLVDGDPQVDAKADTTDGPEGRRVSVKAVK